MNANQIFQRGGGVVRGIGRAAGKGGRRIAGEVSGFFEEARSVSRGPKPGMDDITLARKVETELFRGRAIPKSTVNVNVVDGVVWLRGEVKRPEQVNKAAERVSAIPEVRGVENLLHLTKTPAPTRADTPKRQQRTRSSTRRPKPRTTKTGRVSDDHADQIAPEAEPSPVERAKEKKGRTPAPLGSSDGGSEPGQGTNGGESN